MLALGLILIILAALAVLTVLFGANSAAITFDLTFFDIETTPVIVFFLGAATLLVLVAGIGLVSRGTRREMRLRKDRKELERLHAREAEQRRTTAADQPRHRDPEVTPDAAPDTRPDAAPPPGRTGDGRPPV